MKIKIWGISGIVSATEDWILQRPLELKGKLGEHHAQSSVRKFLMLTVWPSIALYRRRIPNRWFSS